MKTTLVAVLLLLLGAGCSGDAQERKPYSARDLAWIDRYDKWFNRYAEESQKIQPVYERLFANTGDVGPLRHVLRPYRQCARRLRAAVRGAPEHPQLRHAYELMLKGCEQDRDLSFRLVRSVTPGSGPGPAGDLAQSSDASFLRASELIEDGLVANWPLPVRGGRTGVSRIEPRLSKAAKLLTLQEIEVRCWSSEDWTTMRREWDAYAGDLGDPAGFVTGATRAHIAPSFCSSLARFLYANWRPVGGEGLEELADAVELVAHEIEHLYETQVSEAETECHAVQSMKRLARLLGASPSYAARLQQFYWTELYPYEDEEYVSPKCRSGGPYDRRPDTSAFP